MSNSNDCKAHVGHVGNSGIQGHSCGDDFPVIVTLIGGYPRADNSAFYRVSNQGISNDCKSREDRDRFVARHKCAERIADAIWAAWKDSNGSGCSVGCAGYAGCPDDGYLASYKGQEKCVRLADFSYRDVYAYVHGRVGNVGLSDFYGLWAHDGYVFLDVSQHFADRDDCVDFAAKHDQIAYFDCEDKVSRDVRYA